MGIPGDSSRICRRREESGGKLRLTERVTGVKKLGLVTMSSNPDTRPNSLPLPHPCGAGHIPSSPEAVKAGELNPEFVPSSYKRREASPSHHTGQAIPQVTENISLLQPITRLRHMRKFRNVIAACVLHARA